MNTRKPQESFHGTPKLSENPGSNPNPNPNPIFIIISWLLVAVWAVVIFSMSSNTGSGLSDDLGFFSQIYQLLTAFEQEMFGVGVDVMAPIAHFFEYLVFGILLVNALRHHLALKQAVILAIVCGSLYGITDEFHQYFVPERMSDPVDWLVDTIGASVGVGLFCLVTKKQRAKSPKEPAAKITNTH